MRRLGVRRLSVMRRRRRRTPSRRMHRGSMRRMRLVVTSLNDPWMSVDHLGRRSGHAGQGAQGDQGRNSVEFHNDRGRGQAQAGTIIA